MTECNRKHDRYALSNDSRIFCILEKSGIKANPVNARLINISLGGMGIAVKREDTDLLKIGSIVKVKCINGVGLLKQFSDFNVEIMWTVNYEELENIAMGCKFLGLNVIQEWELKRYIKSKIE